MRDPAFGGINDVALISRSKILMGHILKMYVFENIMVKQASQFLLLETKNLF